MQIPLWSFALAGALAASVARESCAGRAPAQTRPVAAMPRSLADLSARELRALPGLGEKRSLALVEARWERAPGDPPLYLSDLAGIGAVVETAVRSALEACGRDLPGDSP